MTIVAQDGQCASGCWLRGSHERVTMTTKASTTRAQNAGICIDTQRDEAMAASRLPSPGPERPTRTSPSAT